MTTEHVVPSRTIETTAMITMVTQVAAEFRRGDNYIFRGICGGAILVRLNEHDKKNLANLDLMLFKTFVSDPFNMTEATARNRRSLCHTAAMEDHFPWTIDRTLTLAKNVDAIVEQFSDYWQRDVKKIKKGGPDAVGSSRKTSDKPAPVTVTKPETQPQPENSDTSQTENDDAAPPSCEQVMGTLDAIFEILPSFGMSELAQVREQLNILQEAITDRIAAIAKAASEEVETRLAA